MDIRKPLLMAIICFAIFQNSDNTYAAPTKECFKTDYDYQIFLTYGNGTPEKFGIEGHSTFSTWYGPHEFEKMKKAGEHGPAQRKDITITVNGSVVNNMITLDASESKTPSGKIEYAWGNPADPVSTDSHISSEGNNKPTKVSVPIMVKDPVCETSKSTNATYTVK